MNPWQNNEVESLQLLVDHPGWTLVMAHLNKQKNIAYAAMQNGDTNEEIARAAVVYMTLNEVAKWPDLLSSHFTKPVKK